MSSGDGSRGRSALPQRIAPDHDENQQLIDAIRNYEVDALVVSGPDGEAVVTLERALAHTQELLRQTREILRAAFDQALVGVILCDRDGVIIEHNAAAGRLAGAPHRCALQGTSLLDLVDPEDAPTLSQRIEAIWNGGAPSFEHEGRLLRSDGARRLVKCSANGIRRGGEVDGLLVIAEDVTARRRAEERQEMFLAELNHRVKNLTTTIEAIAIQALDRATSLDHFRSAFLGRLGALSDAHAMLSGKAVDGVADLRDVVETVLAPHRDGAADRVSVHGSPTPLPARAAVTLSLALHELATNAVKYGCLCTPDGHLDIAWDVEGGDCDTVTILWRETASPTGEPRDPLTGGFGLDFIRTSIEYELSGSVDLHLEPQGLSGRIRFPLPRPLAGA